VSSVYNTKLPEPTDREKVVLYTRSLERAPLDPDADAKRAWLVSWLEGTHALTITVCDVMDTLSAQEKDKLKQAVEDLVFAQYLAGSASYLIEHPGADPAGDDTQIAGVRSALVAYRAVRQATEDGTSIPKLDRLADKESESALAAVLAPRIQAECRPAR
jgi:hypothetical protein